MNRKIAIFLTGPMLLHLSPSFGSHVCAPPAEIFATSSNENYVTLGQSIVLGIEDKLFFEESTLENIKRDAESGEITSIGENKENFICFRDSAGRHIIFSSGAMGGWHRLTSLYVGYHKKDLDFEDKCSGLSRSSAILRESYHYFNSLIKNTKIDGLYTSSSERSTNNSIETRRVDFSVVKSKICWARFSLYDSM